MYSQILKLEALTIAHFKKTIKKLKALRRSAGKYTAPPPQKKEYQDDIMYDVLR